MFLSDFCVHVLIFVLSKILTVDSGLKHLNYLNYFKIYSHANKKYTHFFFPFYSVLSLAVLVTHDFVGEAHILVTVGKMGKTTGPLTTQHMPGSTHHCEPFLHLPRCNQNFSFLSSFLTPPTRFFCLLVISVCFLL